MFRIVVVGGLVALALEKSGPRPGWWPQSRHRVSTTPIIGPVSARAKMSVHDRASWDEPGLEKSCRPGSRVLSIGLVSCYILFHAWHFARTPSNVGIKRTTAFGDGNSFHRGFESLGSGLVRVGSVRRMFSHKSAPVAAQTVRLLACETAPPLPQCGQLRASSTPSSTAASEAAPYGCPDSAAKTASRWVGVSPSTCKSQSRNRS